MNKLKLIIFLLLLSANFRLQTAYIHAQTPVSPTPVEYQLPYPGILPDHPLYPVKRIRDWFIFTISRNPLKKIELARLFADKKIVMAQVLLEKRKTSLAVDTVVESQSDLLKAASLFPKLAKDNLLPAGLSDRIDLSAKKHREIINKLSVQISDLTEKEKLATALSLNNQAVSLIESVKQ